MPASDEETRELLGRLTVPPDSPRFFEELRARMQEQDRRSARRWRLVATAVAAVALSAGAAAAVVAATDGAGSTVDRTVSCSVASNVAISAGARVAEIPATVQATEFDRVPRDPALPIGPFTTLFVASTVQKGYTLDGTLCRPTAVKLSLGRGSLPSAGVVRRGYYTGFSAVCAFKGRVLMRVRVKLDGDGGAAEAQLVLFRAGLPRPRPLAYVDWSPDLVRPYLSPRCKQ
jgi:hypothetical protein